MSEDRHDPLITKWYAYRRYKKIRKDIKEFYQTVGILLTSFCGQRGHSNRYSLLSLLHAWINRFFLHQLYQAILSEVALFSYWFILCSRRILLPHRFITRCFSDLQAIHFIFALQWSYIIPQYNVVCKFYLHLHLFRYWRVNILQLLYYSLSSFFYFIFLKIYMMPYT